jgi:glutathione S-transferase
VNVVADMGPGNKVMSGPEKYGFPAMSDAEKAEYRAKAATTYLVDFWKKLESDLSGEGTNGWLVGKRMTIADIYIACTMYGMMTPTPWNKGFPNSFFSDNKFEKLLKLYENVRAHPEIKKYLDACEAKKIAAATAAASAVPAAIDK